MSGLTTSSLVAYLFSLAATQTVYGAGYMSLRWVALALFCLFSGADYVYRWLTRPAARTDNTTEFLLIYLLASASTVVFAENWMFSGMRWGSHAMMLLSLVLFLRSCATSRQIGQIILLLKIVTSGLMITSWFLPSPHNVYDSENLYRGAMGNANTLGQIALITSLLFLHGFFTCGRKTYRELQGALAFAAISTVWISGARSSMLALLCGMALLVYYYRRGMQRAVIIGVFVLSLATVVSAALPREAMRFLIKREAPSNSTAQVVLKTRTPVWLASWEAFRQRPFLGWGFGADSNISPAWTVRLTALGTVERDAVNDFLFMLEGGGIVGLSAYLILIVLVIKQRPDPSERRVLADYRAFTGGPECIELAFHHCHAIFFVLSVTLLVLNQFDGTALSAGNLVSATLWLSAGAAGVLLDRARLLAGYWLPTETSGSAGPKFTQQVES